MPGRPDRVAERPTDTAASADGLLEVPRRSPRGRLRLAAALGLGRASASARSSRSSTSARSLLRPAGGRTAPGGRPRPRRSSCRRGTTTGPAAVLERGQHRADARMADDDPGAAHVVDELLEREWSCQAARAGRNDARPHWITSSSSPGRRVERAQQPVELERLRAERDEDHASSTLPRYRACGQRLEQLGPLDVDARRDRPDQPAAQRRPLDARHALDVDDLRAEQPPDPRERDGDTGAGREHDPRPRAPHDADGEPRGSARGS